MGNEQGAVNNDHHLVRGVERALLAERALRAAARDIGQSAAPDTAPLAQELAERVGEFAHVAEQPLVAADVERGWPA